ncbi:uncharacterized protein N7484_008112 [Penicillium longicatenatum]|uniref:uncharacterized protein n=1 Tax=Penicillium longicatenatum TaxID=1561947 RepID=UPI0025475F0E|nr:uncharacterized protein N7484_008112 [Penicillium longicatenatum]KAJ5640250.1 hypothetical protein N7484_008112 [Penicillium longicatenatum]
MEESNPPGSGWRISKACQECRKRKIRCNGLNPCKTCQQRETPCVYRDFIRHRRKKNEYREAHSHGQARRASPDSTMQPSRPRSSSVMNNFPNSVSATHMTSPSCQMQLYYGPTSHFALMQHIYRDLIANPTAHPGPSTGVDEAGAGLDLFSFRRIFFGTPDTQDAGKVSSMGDVPVMFLPYDLAKMFLTRFLSSLYHMTPHHPPAYFENCLEQLYNPFPGKHPDTLTQATILLGLATAAVGTEYFAWGDILYERVKASLTSYDEVVNLQTVQISLLMISCVFSFYFHCGCADENFPHANYQNEQGRPNSAFLHLGSAARKALAAGLHKDVPYGEVQTPETVEMRRITFWSLYLFETWFCFHTGRPSSLSLKDVAIENTQDPFMRSLVHLCKTISRSTDEIYGQNHESLLHMWRVARSINNDLRGHEEFARQMGFGLDASIQTGSMGIRQTIFTTLYYHTLLLTFRPFLIFRGHLLRQKKVAASQAIGSSNRAKEIPSWLNEACQHTLTAARKTIHHLSEASRVNDLVRQLRYHGYFLGSSAFTLIYDLIHDTAAAAAHLPWVYASLQTLSTMRPGDPISSSIAAIQTTLRNINPSYEWLQCPKAGGNNAVGVGSNSYLSRAQDTTDSQQAPLNGLAFPSKSVLGPSPDLSPSQWSLPQLEGPETGRSGGSNEDLLDFTQSDMGWDFDFSTMDLEAFFSVYQSSDPLFMQ